jgi:hypothetical protein
MAHDKVKGVISNINKAKKAAEVASRLQQIIRDQTRKELRKTGKSVSRDNVRNCVFLFLSFQLTLRTSRSSTVVQEAKLQMTSKMGF